MHSKRKLKQKRNPTTTSRRHTSEWRLLPKTERSRILSVETYKSRLPRRAVFDKRPTNQRGMVFDKANCLNRSLIAYNSLKTGEDNTNSRTSEGWSLTDFGHVLMASLDGYDGPVIIKVCAIDFNLKREQIALSAIETFPHHAKVICDFSCNDDQKRWLKSISAPTKLCIGNKPLHFFVIEYIHNGDLKTYITQITDDTDKLRSILEQIMYCFIELAQKYNIYHGDIHSGNILIDSTDEEHSIHIINEQERKVKTHGKVPKLIDFGRSGLYNSPATDSEIVFELNVALCVCIHYIQNKNIRDKLNSITLKPESDLSLNTYIEWVLSVIQ